MHPICTQETTIIEFIAGVYKPHGSMSASTNVMVHFLQLSDCLTFISEYFFPSAHERVAFLDKREWNRTHSGVLEPSTVTGLAISGKGRGYTRHELCQHPFSSVSRGFIPIRDPAVAKEECTSQQIAPYSSVYRY